MGLATRVRASVVSATTTDHLKLQYVSEDGFQIYCGLLLTKLRYM